VAQRQSVALRAVVPVVPPEVGPIEPPFSPVLTPVLAPPAPLPPFSSTLEPEAAVFQAITTTVPRSPAERISVSRHPPPPPFQPVTQPFGAPPSPFQPGAASLHPIARMPQPAQVGAAVVVEARLLGLAQRVELVRLGCGRRSREKTRGYGGDHMHATDHRCLRRLVPHLGEW
jgi:hypothetical protein